MMMQCVVLWLRIFVNAHGLVLLSVGVRKGVVVRINLSCNDRNQNRLSQM